MRRPFKSPTLVLALILLIIWTGGCAATATVEPPPQPTPVPTATPLPTASPIPIPTGRYQTPGDYIDEIVVNHVPRWFAVHIPPGYQPGVPMPLLLNLHGHGGNAFQHEERCRMNAKADEAGFIAVHPQALDNPSTWWGVIPGPVGQADMDYFEAMLAYLQQVISIDPARIYVTGISNGGTMANRLGCDMAETFAAIAPVAAGHSAIGQCAIDHPVSVLVIHGTNDSVIPYEGNDADVPPVRLWVEAWAERNGCDLTPVISQPHDKVTVESWENCTGGVVVTFYSVEGGGHTWPGSPQSVYAQGTSFDATDVIWDFFQAHPQAEGP